MESSSKPNGPVQVFKARSVSASVFANRTKEGQSFHKACLQRTYWDGQKYQVSDSFGRDDIPIAVRQLEQAFDFILATEEAAKKKAAEEK